MYRVGIIGYGLAGRVFHAPLIKACDGLQLCNIASSRIAEIQQDHPQVAVLSPDELINNTDIDIVVIATPNHLHAEHGLKALQANKHLVIEKPLALNHEQCQQLSKAADEANKCVAVFHNRRWDGDFLSIQRLLQAKSLGQLHTYKAHHHRYRPLVKQRWKEQQVAGGGVLYDLGAHLIDQSLCLFGMPDSISARVLSQRPGAKAPDHFDLNLNYPQLQVQLSSNSLSLAPGPRYELHGNLGSYAKWGLDPQEQQLAAGLPPSAKRFGQDHQRSELHLAEQALVHYPLQQGRYLAFYQNLVQTLQGQAELAVDIQQASRVVQLIELAMLSHAQRQSLALN